MAVQECSAGVICYRTTSSGARNYLLLDYGRHWDYPKGHLEKGESDKEAAIRELREETGITRLNMHDGFEHELAYFFRHPRRGVVRKTVTFFLASTTQKEIDLSHEHKAYAWLSFEDALQQLTFSTARKALEAAEHFLKSAENQQP